MHVVDYAPSELSVPNPNEERIWDSSKKSRISSISESQLSNSCRCSNSILKALLLDSLLLGYGPVSFFAPHLGYSSGNDPLICLDEFRTMVKELHRAGIEVILDVSTTTPLKATRMGQRSASVGLKTASTTCWRKIGANTRTIPDGNTLKANHSVVSV